MAFFKGDADGVGGHDAMAKEIAEEGKRWTEVHWYALFSSILHSVLSLTLCVLLVPRRRVEDMEVRSRSSLSFPLQPY
jgi:hypothetical protein